MMDNVKDLMVVENRKTGKGKEGKKFVAVRVRQVAAGSMAKAGEANPTFPR